MKEFRVAECLVKGEIHEYAIFKDGSRKKMILTDEKYGKYFYVDNELNTSCKTFLRYSFNDRIKDAVDTIRKGNGDYISMESRVFSINDYHVVYLLDRNIGDELRKKSIEGWKDSKFAWAIKCGNKNSFYPYNLIRKTGNIISVLGGIDSEPVCFETEEEAKIYIEKLIERAAEYTKKIIDNMTGDDKEDEKMMHSILDEAKNYDGSRNTVIRDFILDMLSDDCKSARNNFQLTDMGYKIVQIVQ